jgi:hypothetical protein
LLPNGVLRLPDPRLPGTRHKADRIPSPAPCWALPAPDLLTSAVFGSPHQSAIVYVCGGGSTDDRVRLCTYAPDMLRPPGIRYKIDRISSPNKEEEEEIIRLPWRGQCAGRAACSWLLLRVELLGGWRSSGGRRRPIFGGIRGWARSGGGRNARNTRNPERAAGENTTREPEG